MVGISPFIPILSPLYIFVSLFLRFKLTIFKQDSPSPPSLPEWLFGFHCGGTFAAHQQGLDVLKGAIKNLRIDFLTDSPNSG